ncbi:MAG: cell division protein SepF [Nanoarchaeota archaeon]
MAFNFKRLLGKESDEDYFEIDVDAIKPEEKKIIVKPFVLKNFDSTNDILASLRDGYTIAVIDIKPLKSKDIIELKRAIAKIKKTVDALEGSIAGFGENVVIATPQFAHIHKPMEKKKDRTDYIKEISY